MRDTAVVAYDFETVYREFRPKVYRFLLNHVGVDDADDLTQTVFVKISRALPDFRDQSSLSTWVYRIASNTAADHFRSRGCMSADASFEEDEPVAEEQENTDDRYILEEMRGCIRGLVNELPESHRSILLLTEFEELSAREVANVLDISVETVKIRLHRARKHLRRLMENRCSLYRDGRNVMMCDRK